MKLQMVHLDNRLLSCWDSILQSLSVWMEHSEHQQSKVRIRVYFCLCCSSMLEKYREKETRDMKLVSSSQTRKPDMAVSEASTLPTGLHLQISVITTLVSSAGLLCAIRPPGCLFCSYVASQQGTSVLFITYSRAELTAPGGYSMQPQLAAGFSVFYPYLLWQSFPGRQLL